MARQGQQGRLGPRQAVWLAGFLGCTVMVAGAEAEAPPVKAPAAEDATPVGYSEAISEAVGHYSAGRWRRAYEAFARAHALQPSARTYRGLGLAAFYLEDFAEAREAFEQALADSRRPLPDDQRGQLTDLLRACARETGRFELRIVPPPARVELNGTATERRVLYLDRGEHVISVSAEGHASERIVLTVVGGEERTLDVALVAAPREQLALLTPSGPTAVEDYSEEAPSEKGGRVLTWVAAAAVPAFAGVAVAVWLSGKAQHDEIEDECEIDRCSETEAQRRFDDANLDAHATWTNVSLAASGVALVMTVVLFVIEGDEASATGLEVSASRSGAALSGRF